MLIWIIQTSIISILLIFLVHHLFIYFKNTLTIPKVKNLVNYNKKYNDLYNLFENSNNTIEINEKQYTEIDLLPKSNEYNNKDIMKNELKNFLKSQLNNQNDEAIDIDNSNSNNTKFSYL